MAHGTDAVHSQDSTNTEAECMTPAAYPADEPDRIAALQALNILDTPVEAEFDALAKAASLVCQVPISLISLIDSHRQWFKANVGLPQTSETPRELAFCAHAIHQDAVFEVPNALEDLRFADNPLVTGYPEIRFYAGAPVRLKNGARVGTLCVIDREPRTLTDTQRQVLVHLATAAARALESRKAEVELAQQSQKLQDILDVTGATSWGWNVQTGAFAFDTSARTTSTLKALFDRVHPDDLARMQKTMDLYLRGETSRYECEIRMAKEAGGWAWVLSSGRVFSHSADGRPLWVMGTHLDVTSRVLQLQALDEARQRIHLAADAGGMGVWDYDLTDGVWLWDEWMYRLYGLNGRTGREHYSLWSGCLHPQDREAAEHALQAAIDGGERFDTRFRIVWADGSVRHLRAAANVARDARGKAVRMIGVNWDVTEEEKFASELQKARRLADEANTSKSRFLANMSHEIRTPLNAVLGMTGLALRTELTPKQRGYLEKATLAGQGLMSVINDILDFSKIESGKLDFEHCDFFLSHVLEQLAALSVMKAHDKGLELLFSVEPEVPVALIGDEMRLGQVLLNLVNNAIKFTSTGEVRVQVKGSTTPEGKAALRFEVHDTGIGLTREQAARLFNAFAQADASTTRVFGGSGLGLAISQRLVELMGGRIWVESEPGVGSCFVFTVTLDLQAQLNVSGIALDPRLRQLRVLVIDDNSTARMILSGILNALQVAVHAVESGEEGLLELEAAQKSGTPYHLVLVDWQMPTLDGIETVRQIRACAGISSTLAAVMVTAFGRDELLEQAQGLRLNGVMEKPVSMSRVMDAIAEALGHSLRVAAVPHRRDTYETLSARLKGARILLVEDNAFNRELSCEILADAGMSVDTASNGLQALEMVQQHRYDAVLMDWQMPVMDGLEATRLIRSMVRFADLPILALTANAMTGDREKCLAAGINDHIPKPIDIDQFLATLAKWVVRDGTQAVSDPLVQGIPVLRSGFAASQAPADDCIAPMSGVDLQGALMRLRGNTGQYRRLMSRFAQHYTTALDDIGASMAAGDFSQAQLQAHSLKGIAAHLGAIELVRCAQQLEWALKEKPQRYPDLLAAVGVPIQALLDGIAAQQAPPPEAISATPADQSQWAAPLGTEVGADALAQMQALASMLACDEADADQIAEGIAVLLRGSPLEHDFRKISRLVHGYDFEAAQVMLGHLINRIDSAAQLIASAATTH